VGTAIPELDGTHIVEEAPASSPKTIVALITPADLQQKGQRLDRLDGPVFFRRLIRRLGTLVETYCQVPAGTGACDYRALAMLADQVVVTEQQVKTQSWERFSTRLQKIHPLTGLVGQALMTNIPEPLWPYLILGQWVHLGKGASFGQGQYVALSRSEPGSSEKP
jgi:CRISPR-associated endoribonuclease Cas6